MQTILNTALPLFALIFCGYGAGRFRLLSEASIVGVNAFVFYFALPAFIFGLLATSPLAAVVNVPFVAAYLGTGLVVFAVASVLGRLLFEVRRGEAALQGSAAVLGNTGYMGIPLVAAAFGDRAAIPSYSALPSRQRSSYRSPSFSSKPRRGLPKGGLGS